MEVLNDDQLVLVRHLRGGPCPAATRLAVCQASTQQVA